MESIRIQPTDPLMMEMPSRDILECVFRVLGSYADFARASTVSHEWQAVAAANPAGAPMLMLPSTLTAFIGQYVKISPDLWLWGPSKVKKPSLPTPAISPSFLHVFSQGASVLRNPRSFPSGARFLGSSAGGWMALALDDWGTCCLFNLYTEDRRPLPDLIRTPEVEVDTVVAIKHVVLSSSPDSKESGLVAAITAGASNVAFWRPSSGRWWPPMPRAAASGAELSACRQMLPRDPVEDMIFFHGACYVIDTEENLIAYLEDAGWDDEETAASNAPIYVKMLRYQFRSVDVPDRAVLCRYLVEVGGSLFLVRRFEKPTAFEFLALTEEGMVHCSNIAMASWRRSPELDGCVFFLGKGCSTCEGLGIGGKIIIHVADQPNGWFYPR